jgi:hypothetical protein
MIRKDSGRLKKYSGNRKETPPVDIDTFFEYFNRSTDQL